MRSQKRFEKSFNLSFLSGRNDRVKRGHCRGLPSVTTWHPYIYVRTNVTGSEYPIRIRGTGSQLCGVPLKLHNALRIGFLTHSHEQSFSLCQEHARWDVTLSPQAACYTLHHTACKLRWQVNHQVTPTSNPYQPPKGWWLLCHQLCCHHDYESQEAISAQMWHRSKHYKSPLPTQNQGTCVYTQ